MIDQDDTTCSRDDFFTTYRQNYQAYSAESFPKIISKRPQRDVALLSGHFRNNLQVNGRTMKSKVWPETNFGVEEYESYLSRLESCKKLIYDLFFRNKTTNAPAIEELLKDLERTVYQTSYGSKEYVTVKEQKRIAMAPYKANMKYHETTYRTYYNRIEELERFKKFMVSKLCKEDREEIKNQLRKIYITGRSTYYDTICLPAIAINKMKTALEAPIDQHTWRRV